MKIDYRYSAAFRKMYCTERMVIVICSTMLYYLSFSVNDKNLMKKQVILKITGVVFTRNEANNMQELTNDGAIITPSCPVEIHFHTLLGFLQTMHLVKEACCYKTFLK